MANAKKIRIAIGSIFQETNHFVTIRTDLKLFQNSFLLEGEEVLQLANTDCEVAGMLEVCQAQAVEVVPLLATRSISGGPLTTGTYAYLKQGLVERLRAAGPIDGLLLAMHGAMATESEDDPEGDLLVALCALLEPDIPVVMTLDLHAHVTDRMVQHTMGLVSFRHYPHDDTYSTGQRGARLLMRILRDNVRPAQAVAKVPMLVAGCEGMTFGPAPMAEMVARAEQLEADPRVLSVSVVHVQPYLDIAGMGCGGVVVTDGDASLAEELARSIAAEFWQKRQRFMPEVLSVADAVARGQAIADGPVLLVDTADCTGGGAAGDSVALLRALLALDLSRAHVRDGGRPRRGRHLRCGGGRQPRDLVAWLSRRPDLGDAARRDRSGIRAQRRQLSLHGRRLWRYHRCHGLERAPAHRAACRPDHVQANL